MLPTRGQRSFVVRGNTMKRIGIIGGSGLYEIEGLRILKRINVRTPFGRPSDRFILGLLEAREIVFLPRHGQGHRLLPSEINYRANIWGMKKLGVEQIISVSACGSLKKEIKPLDFVLPDQFIDRTNQARRMSFFGNGIVAHVSFAQPVCPDLLNQLYDIIKGLGIMVHKGGTYINMEGPAFSTRAESEMYRMLSASIIGMTNMAEARLAREAEICYASISSVTDYDCWYESQESVTNEMVIENFKRNNGNARQIIRAIGRSLKDSRRDCDCSSALKYAIMTDRRHICQGAKKRLKIILGKYGLA